MSFLTSHFALGINHLALYIGRHLNLRHHLGCLSTLDECLFQHKRTIFGCLSMLDENIFHRRKPHSGCLSTLDECFFHIRSSFRMSVYGGWMPLSHERTLFRDIYFVLTCNPTQRQDDQSFRCLLQNQEEGDSTLSKTEIVANINVKILALSRKFEHPSIQTPEVCFLLQPDNYKDQAQAFVSLSSPKA